jgi:hypothetical protein
MSAYTSFLHRLTEMTTDLRERNCEFHRRVAAGEFSDTTEMSRALEGLEMEAGIVNRAVQQLQPPTPPAAPAQQLQKQTKTELQVCERFQAA